MNSLISHSVYSTIHPRNRKLGHIQDTHGPSRSVLVNLHQNSSVDKHTLGSAGKNTALPIQESQNEKTEVRS